MTAYEAEQLKLEVKAITVDGPSGKHFQRILIKIIDELIRGN